MIQKEILRAAEICALLNISASCFYKWIRKGFFPQGFAYGPHTVGWERTTVEAWLQARKDGARAASRATTATPPWTK